tara:strand:- start:8710 stop:8988 length:279 start_codon:yes stop_codon:yes gene_type:complete
MSDDNGQEPDMSDKEKIAANEYAIRNCLEKYDDPLDFVLYFMSCIDRNIIHNMAALIICEALDRDEFFHKENRISKDMFEALGKEVKHTHGI